MPAEDDLEESLEALDAHMQDLFMAAVMEKQAELETLSVAFGDLADGALADFGCEESCMEDCFMNDPYNAEMCAATTCCAAVQAIDVQVTQTNIQCQFNQAKRVQCQNADF